MHVKSIKLNFIESIHLKKIVVRIVFFRSIYVIIWLMMNVLIDDVKIKTLFNNNVEINYMSKKLIDTTQLFIHQKISIIMINFINKRVHFFNICESIFVSIKNIIVFIFVFMIQRLNHNFLFNCFFQRIAHMNIVNINNDLLKIILHLLNNEK